MDSTSHRKEAFLASTSDWPDVANHDLLRLIMAPSQPFPQALFQRFSVTGASQTEDMVSQSIPFYRKLSTSRDFWTYCNLPIFRRATISSAHLSEAYLKLGRGRVCTFTVAQGRHYSMQNSPLLPDTQYRRSPGQLTDSDLSLQE